MRKCPFPIGILNFKYSTFILLYFHMPSCVQNMHKVLSVESVFLHLSFMCISYCICFYFHYHPHPHLSLPFFPFWLISPSPPSSIHITISFCLTLHLPTVSLSLSFVYMCSDADKSRPCWNACAADLVLIVRQPRWAFRTTAFFSDQMTHRR